jgi:hypothetical protein
LNASYTIASDPVVWIHLAQLMSFCEYINEKCGKRLDTLADHKILNDEPVVRFVGNVENEITRRSLN